MNNLFARAETFLWSNARLLERRLFAYHFRGSSREAVLAALRADQNEDGKRITAEFSAVGHGRHLGGTHCTAIAKLT